MPNGKTNFSLNSIAITIALHVLVSSTLSFVSGDENESYDFVVVGAGPAGCVVARRLSAKYSVLLIEAGGEPNPDLNIPAKAPRASNKENTKIYTTSPEKNAGLENNGRVAYATGRSLGGGTAVNGMMYNRGSAYDYDNWANTTGDPSWSYKEMLKYFKRIEDYKGNYPSEEYHGTGGPITVSSLTYVPGMHTWLEAGKYFGYPNSDPNGRQMESFTSIESSRLLGHRVSSYRGYIQSILSATPNLKLVKNAKVTNILFQGNKAVGVKFVTKEGEQVVVSVLKEVVLSCGVFGSPALLLKSGIGPKDVLESANITTVKYLPAVGQNLHDHPLLFLTFLVKKDKADVFDARRDLTEEALKQYERTGEGPYSCYNGVTAQAFLVSSVRAREKAPNPEWPDVQVILFQTPIDFGAGTAVNEDDVAISTLVILTRPKSRGGRLTLNTTNIEADPLINFQYFSNSDDMEAMVDAVKKVVQIFENATSYREQGARYIGPLRFCKHLDFRSDEYWKCYVMYMSGSGNHGAGSCRMGKSDDSNAVVTSDLKVIGIQNVRVADTSIMPAVTNANTQAPAFVIGEKAADNIIKDWEQAE